MNLKLWNCTSQGECKEMQAVHFRLATQSATLVGRVTCSFVFASDLCPIIDLCSNTQRTIGHNINHGIILLTALFVPRWHSNENLFQISWDLAHCPAVDCASTAPCAARRGSAHIYSGPVGTAWEPSQKPAAASARCTGAFFVVGRFYERDQLPRLQPARCPYGPGSDSDDEMS